jgi:adenine-specific DNA methylase
MSLSLIRERSIVTDKLIISLCIMGRIRNQLIFLRAEFGSLKWDELEWDKNWDQSGVNPKLHSFFKNNQLRENHSSLLILKERRSIVLLNIVEQNKDL